MEKSPNKIRLYCLPYAGATAHIFQRFRPHLNPEIEIVPLDPPGHGSRIDEPLIPSCTEMAEILYGRCRDDIERGGDKFAFFGHSMGSILAYLITRILRDKKGPMPIHLFLSGSAGPLPSAAFKNVHLLPDNEFVKKLVQLGGLQESAIATPLVVDQFLPILKSDFQAYSEFGGVNDNPVPVPLSVFLGSSDNTTCHEPIIWDSVTSIGATRFYFEGGHFFLMNYIDTIAAIIRNTLIPSPIAI